ncbi:MAG: DUF3189 family protein [Caulobacteraceae bacterium]
MVIIYNCYGGTHSSILASAVHLKKLPSDRVATKKEILGTDYFNALTYKDMGRLIFHGVDEEGNKVYSIGRGTSRALIPAMRNLVVEMRRQSGANDCFAFVNCSPTVPLTMTIGGFFSRGLHIDFVGVPLLALGARQTYNNIIKLVEKSKEICRQRPEKCLVIDIDGKGRLSYFN